MLLPPLLLACTASHWRIADPAPWGSESTMFQHDELEKMALNACPLTQDEMLSPKFVSNGCSVWPDAKNYLGCCVQHDLAYWCGGSRQDRAQADAALRECVIEAHPWTEQFIKVHCAWYGSCAFPRYTDCPVKWDARDTDKERKLAYERNWDRVDHEANPIAEGGKTQ